MSENLDQNMMSNIGAGEGQYISEGKERPLPARIANGPPSGEAETEQLRIVSEELLEEVLFRKRTEEELQSSKAFLQTVIDAIPDVLLVIDRAYRIVMANRAACDLAGGINPVSACMACHTLSHHRDVPCEGDTHPCPLQQVIETRAPVATTHVHYDAAGNQRTVEIIAAPIFAAGGEVVQMVETCRDITQRVQMEQALHESEERYRIVADYTRDWEFWVGPDGRFRYASPSVEEIAGRVANVGDSAEEFFRLVVHPEDLERRLAHLQEELAGKGPGEMKFRIVRADGTLRWIHHICQPIRDAAGRFLGVRASNRDITTEMEPKG